MHRFLALAVLGALTSQASAQSTRDVSISGSLVPGSCTPSITNGGVIDFNTIPVSALDANTPTMLAGKPGGFTFTCAPAATMGFRLIDNRFSTQLGTEQSAHFGLGNAANGVPIGNFRIHLKPSTVVADTLPAVLISRLTGPWSAPGDNMVRHANPDLSYAFAQPATLVPLALTTAGFDFDVEPTINSTSALQVTQDIALDGNATLEIVYH